MNDPRFWKTTLNTLYWTVGSTFFAFVLGFGAALALHEPFPGRGIVRAVLLIPWVVSAVAAAYVWRWVLHSDFGLVSGTLKQWGVIDRPLVLLDSKTRVMPTLIAVNVWKEFPFVMIMMTAGLQTVPEGLLRAARVDGAGAWSRFWHVTVPHLRGIILITTLLLFVGNLNSFTLVWLMTGGGPANASQLWITEIYNIGVPLSCNTVLASAFSVISLHHHAALGYFYVKALTANDDRGRRAEQMTNPRRGFKSSSAWRAGFSWRCWWRSPCCRWSGWSRRRSRLSLPRSQQPPESGYRPSRRSSSTRLSSHRTIRLGSNSCDTSATASGYQRRQQCSALVARARRLCLLPLQLPRSRAALLLRARAQHVPGRRLPHPALHPHANGCRLVDTHWSLILTYLTFGLPLSIWLLKGFYDNIPPELERAARIDGATRFQAFCEDRPAALDSGTRSDRDLLLHPGLERVRLRPDLPQLTG